jgi:hypothetical protein
MATMITMVRDLVPRRLVALIVPPRDQTGRRLSPAGRSFLETFNI